MPHTAACCCSKHQQKMPRAQQYTSLLIPCAHRKLNVKHHRTTPKPETHHGRGRSCTGEKTEHLNVYKRHSHHPAPRRLSPTRQQASYTNWVELVRVCRLAVVSAAAVCRSVPQCAAECCSYCVTTRTRPRQTRHGVSEGRGVAQFPPSGQPGWYIYILAVWMGV